MIKMFELTIKLLGITLFLTLTGMHASGVLLCLQPGKPEVCVPFQTANNLNTEWVGNTELNGKIIDFISVRLAENDGQLRLPWKRFTAKLSSLRFEGSSLHCEFSRDAFKLVLTGTIAGDKIEGQAEAGGTKARFYLVRSKLVAPEILAGYTGAYRFPSGEILVIDRFADTPNTLFVTKVKSGEVRVFFPTSDTQLIAGPSLFVPLPTMQTIAFRSNRAGVTGLDLTATRQSPARATRIPIRQEEVKFRNGEVTLAGTLFLPRSSRTRHPAIVFTHGGGAALREMFWGLGYLYASRGVAVLVYDKRGVGESKGNWREASFEDLADDAVAGAKFLQSRTEINRKRIGFWGLSQGGWIAPLAAARFADSAFAIALSGGGLSPAEQELLDTEFELQKAGYARNEIDDAVSFQKLKNEIIRANEKWDQYAKARSSAIEKKWYRVQGIDIRGPDKRDDGYWTNMRRFYFYDPAPTLRNLKCPLLAIFGEEDTPEGVKANAQSIRRIMDAAGQKDYTVKVYPRGRHNLIEVPSDKPDEFVHYQRFVPGLFETMVNWTLIRTNSSRRVSEARP